MQRALLMPAMMLTSTSAALTPLPHRFAPAGVPVEALEQLSSSLGTFCSPYMLLYAVAVARATGASLAEGTLFQLISNGLLPRAAWGTDPQVGHSGRMGLRLV
jgi:hypothetical protein